MSEMLWQLKKLSTNEPLNKPQVLPKNWGAIFGMEGFKDKLGDLSWIGKPDMGWFEVGPAPEIDDENLSKKEYVDSQISALLKSSLDKVASDNLEITKGERADWMEYRRLVKEIPLQPGYPETINWPKRPV